VAADASRALGCASVNAVQRRPSGLSPHWWACGEGGKTSQEQVLMTGDEIVGGGE
jgi:hypothetical protein